MGIESVIVRRVRLRERRADEAALARSARILADGFDLEAKIAREPETLDVVLQMYNRAAAAYPRLGELKGKRILDLACGSRTSRAPSGTTRLPPRDGARAAAEEGYSSLFEPWLCRILASLRAEPVGVDFGDLGGETFERYRLDLSLAGALDFLPPRSFDAVHDSRLFGSPEFRASARDRAEVLRIAREIAGQEARLLREGGIVIHSDARELIE